MGKTLVIGSCEPFSGKSALVLGIARKLIAAGQPIRFGKPLATSFEWNSSNKNIPDPLIDDDVRFVGKTFGLNNEQLIPSLHRFVAQTAEHRLLNADLDSGEGFEALKKKIQATTEGLTLLEAAGSLHEGLMYGLSLSQIAKGLDAPVLLVHLWIMVLL